MKRKKNSLPFLILFITHSILLGYSFTKTKNKRQLFTLLMSNIGLAYLFEYIVLNLFKAYRYKPQVMKKKFFDDILGAILSQAIFVPFTAVFLTESKSGWIRKVIAAGYFAFVEIVFLVLDVYKHNWWKTIYTFIFIPMYFKVSDIWNLLLSKKYPLVRFVSLFLMIMTTEANLLFIFAVLRKIRFGIGKYHSWNEHFIIVPLHAISLSFFSTLSLLKKNTWGAKLKILAFIMGLTAFFKKINLVKLNFPLVTHFLIRLCIVNLYGKFRDWVYEEKNTDTEEFK